MSSSWSRLQVVVRGVERFCATVAKVNAHAAAVQRVVRMIALRRVR